MQSCSFTEDLERRICGVMMCHTYREQAAAGCCGGSSCANSLIRDMQRSKTYSVIPWSRVEIISIGRFLRSPTFGGSWSQDEVGFCLVHMEAAATALDAVRLNTETFSTGREKRGIWHTFNLGDLLGKPYDITESPLFLCSVLLLMQSSFKVHSILVIWEGRGLNMHSFFSFLRNWPTMRGKKGVKLWLGTWTNLNECFIVFCSCFVFAYDL